MGMEFNPGANTPPPEKKDEPSLDELIDQMYEGNDNADQYNNSPQLSRKKQLAHQPMKKRKAA